MLISTPIAGSPSKPALSWPVNDELQTATMRCLFYLNFLEGYLNIREKSIAHFCKASFFKVEHKGVNIKSNRHSLHWWYFHFISWSDELCLFCSFWPRFCPSLPKLKNTCWSRPSLWTTPLTVPATRVSGNFKQLFWEEIIRGSFITKKFLHPNCFTIPPPPQIRDLAAFFVPDGCTNSCGWEHHKDLIG